MILLDTHIVMWLHRGDLDHIPASVQDLLQDEHLAISPMVELELAYLYEIGRLRDRPEKLITHLSGSIGLQVDDLSLARVVDEARSLSWTRDPFDRLIVAHAAATDVPLVTADRVILNNFQGAVWE